MVLTPFSDYIAGLFKTLLSPQESYHSDLEKYIISMNPTTNEEVEYYTRQFDRRAQGKTPWLQP
jgi:hypothetical protein